MKTFSSKQTYGIQSKQMDQGKHENDKISSETKKSYLVELVSGDTAFPKVIVIPVSSFFLFHFTLLLSSSICLCCEWLMNWGNLTVGREIEAYVWDRVLEIKRSSLIRWKLGETKAEDLRKGDWER
ncbi:unnamed protein product [Lathyrus sativus]|nr:unnamed protein product [Lathyrus sativus]